MIQEQPDNPERYRRGESTAGREGQQQRGLRDLGERGREYTERGLGPEGGTHETRPREAPTPYGEPRVEPGYEPRRYAEHERAPEGYREREGYRGEPHAYEFEEAPPEIRTVYSTSGINIIAGLWLLLAPFALGYANVETALWNSVIVGLAVTVMAIVRVVRPDEYEGISWVNFVLGIWLLVSPFVLGLANIDWLVWNNIIVGVIVLALAATSAMATHRFHHPVKGGHPRRRMYSGHAGPTGRGSHRSGF